MPSGAVITRATFDALQWGATLSAQTTASPIRLTQVVVAIVQRRVDDRILGSAVFGTATTVAATLAISLGLDGDTHVDTAPHTFTVHGATVHDGDVTVLGTLTAPGVPGAPVDAAYVTLSADTELTAERVLTGSGRVSVTDGGAGSTVTLDVPNDGITYAKIQNVTAASRLLGRGSSGGSGDVEELTLGSGLTLTGTVLAASGGAGAGSAWSVLTTGNPTTPELVFDSAGDVIMIETTR